MACLFGGFFLFLFLSFFKLLNNKNLPFDPSENIVRANVLNDTVKQLENDWKFDYDGYGKFWKD